MNTTIEEFRILAEHAGADSVMQAYPVAQFNGPAASVTVEFRTVDEEDEIIPVPPLNVADTLAAAAKLAGK